MKKYLNGTKSMRMFFTCTLYQQRENNYFLETLKLNQSKYNFKFKLIKKISHRKKVVLVD